MLLAAISYVSPVHYPIELAGNFAEPRPNHFHGGVDVKTGQVEGKVMHSIGDGYVSRVTIGLSGFGNAVYVHHPEGYTSVYCHLRSFSPRIMAMVRKYQYRQKCSNGAFFFRPNELPVGKGEFIAFSGNTGSSQAPHLHLEVHETKTWNMVDPLTFIGKEVKDDVAPRAHGLMACPLSGEGSFCGGFGNQVYAFRDNKLTNNFTAWGKVGFAIWANDYVKGSQNIYGVRKQQLFVDGKVVFESDAANIPMNCNLQVNYWGNYQYYRKTGIWYLRSYLLPGVTLPIFKTNKSRGYVDFNEERDYNLEYVLTDYAGNASHYTFKVTGKRAGFGEKWNFNPSTTLRWNRDNTFKLDGMDLSVDKGLLADDVQLTPVVKSGKHSGVYSFKNFSYPLLGFARLSLKITSCGNPSKYYLISNLGVPRYMGGISKNGWVTGKAWDLASTYYLAYDETPPVVGPVGPGVWTSNRQVTISVVDRESGLKTWQGYIDGQYVAFDVVPKSPWVRCKLAETPIKRTGKVHELRFVAVDNRDNIREWTTSFVY